MNADIGLDRFQKSFPAQVLYLHAHMLGSLHSFQRLPAMPFLLLDLSVLCFDPTVNYRSGFKNSSLAGLWSEYASFITDSSISESE